MKRLIIATLLAGALPSLASAQVYVRAATGQASQDLALSSEFDTHQFSVGMELPGPFRIEAGQAPLQGFAQEFFTDGSPADTVQNLAGKDTFVSVFADLSLTERIAIYAGGGVDRFTHHDSNGSHWALGASARLVDHVTLDARFRRVEGDTGDPFNLAFEFDEWTLGARLGF